MCLDAMPIDLLLLILCALEVPVWVCRAASCSWRLHAAMVSMSNSEWRHLCDHYARRCQCTGPVLRVMPGGGGHNISPWRLGPSTRDLLLELSIMRADGSVFMTRVFSLALLARERISGASS